MKKYFSLMVLGMLASFLMWSCSTRDNDDRMDNDTYSVVYDVKGNFKLTGKLFVLGGTFTRGIASSDVVLIYKLVEVSNGKNIWEPLPVIYHANEYKEIPAGKQLKYTYEFSSSGFDIIAGGDFDLKGQSTAFNDGYLNGQTFRVVIVPASAGRRAVVDYSNYEEVIKYFNIDDSKTVSL